MARIAVHLIAVRLLSFVLQISSYAPYFGYARTKLSELILSFREHRCYPLVAEGLQVAN